MKISCEKAAQLCSKVQYKEARFWEVLQLRFHLLYCQACAKFSKRNTTLTALCKRARLTALTKNQKEMMKKVVEEHL